jgi:hypothetical protein
VDASTDVSTQSSYFADVVVTGAATGTLSESGMRVRVDGLAGSYSYFSTTDNQTIHGTQESGAVLLGYQWVSPDIAFAAYLGSDIRNNSLSLPDASNSVVGTKAGAKGELEFFARPSQRTMISADASYATNDEAYFARVRAGYLIGRDLYIGPEFVALGDAFFNQERFGAQLTGLSAGPIRFAFAAGYLYDRVRKSGGYTTIDARVGF